MLSLLIIILLGIIEALSLYIYLVKTNNKKISIIDYNFWMMLFTTLYLTVHFAINISKGELSEKISNTDFSVILLFMALGAVSSALYSLCNLQAMKIGNKGITSGISGSSIAITTTFFILFYNNKTTRFTVPAILLICTAIFLMAKKQKNDTKINKSWLILCIGILVFNAGGQILTSIPSQLGSSDSLGIRGVSVIFFMMIFNLILKLYKKEETNILNIKLAIVTSLITAIVQFTTYPLLDSLSQMNLTYIFTPLKLSVTLTVFSVLSSVYFKEKMSKQQFFGIILCITGILLFMF